MKTVLNFSFAQYKNTCAKMRSMVFYTLLLTCLPSNSNAQYTYDVGLRVSSYELERFQAEGRFHLKKPYTFLASFSAGLQRRFNTTEIPVYPDSVFSTSSEYITKTNQSIRLGVQRDIEFLETDFFYGGIALGFGYVTKLGRFSNSSYGIDSTVNNQIYSYEISFSESVLTTKSLRTELVLSFGVDVPLIKRFSINAEVGLSTNLQTSLDKTESPFLFQYLYASGGVRYSFGRRYGGTPGSPR
jgi:hypothetical protein